MEAKNPTKAYIKQWLYYQAIASLILAVGLGLINARMGGSCALGSIVILLANAYQGLRVTLTRQEYNPVELLKSFYKGELSKFIILGIAVVLLAKFVNLNWWAFFIGIAGAQLGGAFLWMVKGKQWRQDKI